MKFYFLLFFYCFNLSATDLNEYDIYVAKTFLELDSLPEIIQEKDYVEDIFNKIDYKFSIDHPRIQGLYSSNKIYLYDLSIGLDLNKSSCVNIEKFIKKGYLIHELTHFKQTKEDRFKESTKEYKTSNREFEAFANQIDFLKTNLDKYKEDFPSCMKKSSDEWFKYFISANKETQEVFDLYNFVQE